MTRNRWHPFILLSVVVWSLYIIRGLVLMGRIDPMFIAIVLTLWAAPVLLVYGISRAARLRVDA